MSTSSILARLDNLARSNYAKADAFKRRHDARRDSDHPLSAYNGAPADFRDDTHLASERNELRTGALSKADSYNALQRLHNIAAQLPKRLSDTSADRAEFSAVQAKHDSVMEKLNRSAPPPREGEGLYQYEYRLTEELLPYAPKFKDISSLTGLGISAFRIMQPQIFADVLQEAEHPTIFKDGELRMMERKDTTGRPYYEFVGHPRAWMEQFAPPRKRLIGIRTANVVGYFPNNVG